MKKQYTLLPIIIGLIILYGFSGIVLADFDQRDLDERSLKEEKSLFLITPSMDNYDQIDAEQAKSRLNTKRYTSGLADDDIAKASRNLYFSMDPKDLELLKSTVWEFNFTIHSEFSDTITFGNVISTTADGEVTLSCKKQDGREGFVFYTDLPQGGRGFGVTIDGDSLIEFYSFTTSGTKATGKYRHKVKLSGTYSSLYDMTGIQTSGPVPPCFTQADLDAAYNSGYVEGCAKLEANFDITMPCIDIFGTKSPVILEKYNNSDDELGYYWKLKIQ